jgi:hypothetical protein
MDGIAPTTAWARLQRRFGFEHNPLRRRSDLIAAWLLPAVLAAMLVLGPLAAIAASRWAGAQDAAAWRAQRSWHHVPAVLLASAPGPAFADGGANSWTVWTPARWTAGGRTHVANVPATSDAAAGSVVTVWLDRTGAVRVPLTSAAARGRVATAALVAVGALALLLTGLAVLARWLLDRRRLAGWGTDWLSVGPQWSGQR